VMLSGKIQLDSTYSPLERAEKNPEPLRIEVSLQFTTSEMPEREARQESPQCTYWQWQRLVGF
jgi:hypothetical protein